MSQTIRNRVYAVVTSLLSVALVFGFIDQVGADEAMSLVDQLVTLGVNGVGLATAILAWVKSRPSTTATLPVPEKEVDAVTLTSGYVVAGPANAAPTGRRIRTADGQA